jgi:hypothetical protein
MSQHDNPGFRVDDPLPAAATSENEPQLLLDGLVHPDALYAPDGGKLADARTTEGREQRDRIRAQHLKAFETVRDLLHQIDQLRRRGEVNNTNHARHVTELSAANRQLETNLYRAVWLSTVFDQLTLMLQQRIERVSAQAPSTNDYRFEATVAGVKIYATPGTHQVRLTAPNGQQEIFTADHRGNFTTKEVYGLFGFFTSAGITVDQKLMQTVLSSDYKPQSAAAVSPRTKPGSYKAMLDAMLGGIPGQGSDSLVVLDLMDLVPPGFEKYLTEEHGHHYGEYPYNR